MGELEKLNESFISCPQLTSEVLDMGSPSPTVYSAATRLIFGKYWCTPNSIPLEHAHAFVATNTLGLCIYVFMNDNDIFSNATANNQKMWTLGDTVEIFVKPGPSRRDYWEIHVTPNNFLMDIYIIDRERYTNGEITWEDVVTHKSYAQKNVHVNDGSWAVNLCIPWEAFEYEDRPTDSTEWQIAICRYNYGSHFDTPELSSTASFTKLGFHRYEEYTTIVF